MNWPLLIAIAAGVILADAGLFAALIRVGWGGLPGEFPAVPPGGDAVRRPFQSISVGVFNFGFCIHVAIDEDHLHLTPAGFLRWLGARPASIPWQRITFVKRSRWGGRITVRAGRHAIQGPGWCMELAQG